MSLPDAVPTVVESLLATCTTPASGPATTSTRTARTGTPVVCVGTVRISATGALYRENCGWDATGFAFARLTGAAHARRSPHPIAMRRDPVVGRRRTRVLLRGHAGR